MKKLIAQIPILYLSKQYKAGTELPAGDEKMVEAWLKAGSAVWKEEKEKAAVRARRKTAESGISGTAINSETEDNVAGRVPKTKGRAKK